MADVNLAEVLALSSEERRLLASKPLRDLKVEDRPRKSILDYAGAIPWDGRDVDERIRLLREEWDGRAAQLGY